MTAQLVTRLPTPPSRRNPKDFNTRADAFNDALLTLCDQINAATPGDSAAGLAQYLALTEDDKGASLVAFAPQLNYVAKTIGRTISDREWNVRDFPWLAKFDGVTDDTAAITACLNALFNAGGGTMLMPKGTAKVSSIVFNWTNTVGVNIRGMGKRSTFLVASGTAPVLDLSSNTNVLDICSSFRDFAIRGNNKAAIGLRITNIASFSLHNLDIRQCSIGIENRGSLTFSVHNCTIQDHNTGYRCTAMNSIYANLVQFHGTRFAFCTSFGMDLDQGSGIALYGCDLEKNGTAGVVGSGALKMRSTMSQEFGFSSVTVHETWFELNNGQAIVADGGSLHLTISGGVIANTEAGRAINVGAIRSVKLLNIMAPGPADVVTLSAASSVVLGGTIATLTDFSTTQTHIGVTGISGTAGMETTKLLVGSGGIKLLTNSKLTDTSTTFSAGTPILLLQDGQGAGNTHGFFHTNGAAGNAANCGLRVGQNSTTSRSINAGGTINASGADYAEYETKREDCGPIAAGDICGFDADGLLTDRWEHAITFCVKSTAPCIVGGDDWGAGLEGDELEAARVRVDRIAYAGKVPVNVLGAKPGDWINAAQGPGGSIVGVAASRAGNTVGRVRAVLPDGRALIAVRMC